MSELNPVRPISGLSERDRVFLPRLDSGNGGVKGGNGRMRDKGRRTLKTQAQV